MTTPDFPCTDALDLATLARFIQSPSSDREDARVLQQLERSPGLWHEQDENGYGLAHWAIAYQKKAFVQALFKRPDALTLSLQPDELGALPFQMLGEPVHDRLDLGFFKAVVVQTQALGVDLNHQSEKGSLLHHMGQYYYFLNHPSLSEVFVFLAEQGLDVHLRNAQGVTFFEQLEGHGHAKTPAMEAYVQTQRERRVLKAAVGPMLGDPPSWERAGPPDCTSRGLKKGI